MTRNESRAPQQNPAPTRLPVDTAEVSSGGRQVADLKRRRAASYRLPVLESGRSDPWRYDDPPPSQKMADAAADAAAYLLEQGLTPVFSVDTIGALRHRDPELAELLARLRGVA